MSKRSCFRSRFQSQRVYESQTLLKSARQPFYFIVSSSRHRLSWKTSHLVRYKTFGLFVNAVTAYEKDDKYSCQGEISATNSNTII